MSEFRIRSEQPGDIDAITAVTEQAFESALHSEHTEHFIVLALRRAGALSVSLVATPPDSEEVVGHVAFSPVRISDGSRHWYGLGPVSVLPSLQHRGIGKTLILNGLSSLRSLGAAGCVVLGDPDYYRRFGFKSGLGCELQGVPREYFQSLPFGKNSASGNVTYHEAFAAKA